jgi:hypothetical protein
MKSLTIGRGNLNAVAYWADGRVLCCWDSLLAQAA